MSKTELTAERLRELLNYDPETGVFVRRVSTCNRVKVGDVAGSLNPSGYCEIRVLGRTWKAHRLAWLYVTGAWPTRDIDHINGAKKDNRFSNLRDVSMSENKQNLRHPRVDCASGYLGVTRRGARWRAHIMLNGKQMSLGTFATAHEAGEAYLLAKRELHSTCTI